MLQRIRVIRVLRESEPASKDINGFRASNLCEPSTKSACFPREQNQNQGSLGSDSLFSLENLVLRARSESDGFAVKDNELFWSPGVLEC